jgi:hypothetical protein
MKTWVTYKNDKIHNVRMTSDDDIPGHGWLQVPNDFNGKHGDDRAWFNADGYRLSDAELIAQGKRKDLRGRWFNKHNIGETKVVNDLDEEPDSDWTREEPIPNEQFQIWSEEEGTFVRDVTAREIAEVEREIGSLRSEISSRDWKCIKAQRLKIDVEELYPGETDWYVATVERINTLETRLTTLQ